MTTTIKDDVYFLHPEGSGWIAVEIRDGVIVDRTEESDAGTHDAANDNWAGVSPDDSDEEVTGNEAVEIIRLAMGDDVDPDMVAVARPLTVERPDGTYTAKLRDE